MVAQDDDAPIGRTGTPGAASKLPQTDRIGIVFCSRQEHNGGDARVHTLGQCCRCHAKVQLTRREQSFGELSRFPRNLGRVKADAPLEEAPNVLFRRSQHLRALYRVFSRVSLSFREHSGHPPCVGFRGSENQGRFRDRFQHLGKGLYRLVGRRQESLPRERRIARCILLNKRYGRDRLAIHPLLVLMDPQPEVECRRTLLWGTTGEGE